MEQAAGRAGRGAGDGSSRSLASMSGTFTSLAEQSSSPFLPLSLLLSSFSAALGMF